MKRRFIVIRRLLPLAVLLFLGGCANALRNDSETALVSRCVGYDCGGGAESESHFITLPQAQSRNYFETHCDEQTREMQHELANCGAVPLIAVPLERNS
jgi:hypothetical protein